MKASPLSKITRRVYGYFDSKTDKLLYVGSSHCSLKSLEYNHRNAHIKWPDENHTVFRKALIKKIKNGYFKSLIELSCDQPLIEHLEGELIRSLRPAYNYDLDPVRSSNKYNRY